MASNRSWTCIHPLASRIPPDLCLFLYPTFGSSRHCCSSLPDNFYYTPPQLLWGDFTICLPGHIWSGRQDSNLRPPVPKTGVLANWTTSRYVAVFYNTSAQLPWELVSFTLTPDWLPEVSTGLYTTIVEQHLPHNLSIYPDPCKPSHSAWMPCSLKSYTWRQYQGASYVSSLSLRLDCS